MSYTHRHSRGLSQDGRTPLAYDKDVMSDAEVNLSLSGDYSVADGTTDEYHAWPITVALLKSVFIGSDQDVTIETNNPGGASAAPDDTFSIVADQPVDWTENDPEACPITTDVVGIYITNDSGSAANIEIRALVDSTP